MSALRKYDSMEWFLLNALWGCTFLVILANLILVSVITLGEIRWYARRLLSGRYGGEGVVGGRTFHILQGLCGGRCKSKKREHDGREQSDALGAVDQGNFSIVSHDRRTYGRLD